MASVICNNKSVAIAKMFDYVTDRLDRHHRDREYGQVKSWSDYEECARIIAEYSGREWATLQYQVSSDISMSVLAKLDAIVEELHHHPECFEGEIKRTWCGPHDVLVRFKDKLAQAGCDVLVS